MATQPASLATIQDFLAQKRIAIAGISRDPAGFSAMVFKEFCRRGYDVVPVNPNAAELQGRRSFVDAVLLMTSPEVTDILVKDCAEAGIRRIWMHRATGQGSVSTKAIDFCQQQGIDVVPGECPFMFLPNAAAYHRFHGLIRKITGRYPRRALSN